MINKILLVDDDPNVLSGFKRQLRKQFDLHTALGPEEGLNAVDGNGPFAVIVSDLKMPGMDGIQFLMRVCRKAPETVRMMLTGQADLEAAIEAVNEGNIFRFMTKPCPPDTLARMLEAGVQQYQLVKAERELLEKTLRGSVKVLTDILSLMNPLAFGKASRVRSIMRKLADKLDVDSSWEFELAGMLSQTGCVTFPNDVVEKVYAGEKLTEVEQQMFESHPKIGGELIANIPRLEKIAEMIAYQEKNYNGSGIPSNGLKEKAIPIGARALHAALDFDTLVTSGKDSQEALKVMQERFGWYDPQILKTLAVVIQAEGDYEIRKLRVHDLVSGMILAENVNTQTGLLVIAKGQEVTPSLKERLENFNRTSGVHEPIRVYVPIHETKVN